MTRPLAKWLSLCLLLLTAACGSEHPSPTPNSGPALWRIQGPNLDGWLFGTIHILPEKVEWQTPPIRDAIAKADRLVLETSEIQNPAAVQALFEKMGRSAGLPPLENRLPVADRDALNEALDESDVSSRALSSYESWAAAMLLSAGTQHSLDVSPEDGVEPVLIRTFRSAGKPISGLETVQRQFAAFDTLPESVQRKLLQQTVREAKDVQSLYNRVLSAWLKGDIATIARQDQIGGQPDPTIVQAVLLARNRDWVTAVEQIRGHPFIAVGTGHLTGQDNLAQLLETRGYKVTRVR